MAMDLRKPWLVLRVSGHAATIVARLASEQAALAWLRERATDGAQYAVVQIHVTYCQEPGS